MDYVAFVLKQYIQAGLKGRWCDYIGWIKWDWILGWELYGMD